MVRSQEEILGNTYLEDKASFLCTNGVFIFLICNIGSSYEQVCEKVAGSSSSVNGFLIKVVSCHAKRILYPVFYEQ